MSYLVLARKYRPRTFEEVCGQEVPTQVLQGAIREERIGHAYLFSGPRGTGKTTSARIFAKALNCERGPAPTPCGECERCLASERGAEADIIEIDGASNRGIDDARALREEVAYAPMRARFKIYIIDEVHMLTTPAFNALLKTLEEPPPHVKFLFATTEPHKVIETIRSRCQMVPLSLIDEATIAGRLAEILALEQVTPEAGVVEELARLARGSMRDALSVTDQLLALVGTQPTVEDVRRVSGPAGAEQIEQLLSRIAAGDRRGLLDSLPDTEGAERDLVAGLLTGVREALISSLGGSAAGNGADWAAELDADRLQIWLEELLHARERMHQLPEHARIVLEVTLLDLCREETALPLALLVKRLGALEERLGVATPASASAPAAQAAQAPRTPEATSPAPREVREPRAPAAAPQAPPPAPPPAPAPARAPARQEPSAAARPAAPAPPVPPAAPQAAPAAEPARPQTITPPAPRTAPPEAARPPEASEAREAPEASAGPVELKTNTPEASGDGDAFTQRVADLFEGKIEDNS